MLLLTTVNTPPDISDLSEAKKATPAFSGTTFFEGTTRNGANAESIHLLTFDFDNTVEVPIPGEFHASGRPKTHKAPITSPAQPKAVIERLKALGYAAVIYTTWSDSPDLPKFRVVLPLQTPVSPAYWTAATEWAMEHLGFQEWRDSGAIDGPVLRDTARLNFLPCAPVPTSVRSGELDGHPLNIPADVLPTYPARERPKPEWQKPRPDTDPRTGEKWWKAFDVDFTTLNLEGLIRGMGIDVGKSKPYEGGQKWRCHCPWALEHTHGLDDDCAVIIQTPESWPGFKCQHSSHAEVGLREICESVGVKVVQSYAKRYSPAPAREVFMVDALDGVENWTEGQIREKANLLVKLQHSDPTRLATLTNRWHVFDIIDREELAALLCKTVEDEPKPKEERRALDVLHWNAFKDLPVPPVRWIWDPFFPWVPFGVLASHPGHGKSILSLQVAVSVATGLPLFGFATCGPAGAGVLALEDDQNVIHRRLKAIREAYGFTWKPEHDDLMDRNLVVMVRGRTPLEGMEGTAATHQLAQLTKELGMAMRTTQDPPAILFLDTLNTIHGGDENSAEAARPLVAAVFGLHDALNCSVWALHHLRKAGSGRNAPAMTDRLDPELVRGTSAFVGSARAVVQLGWIYPNEAGKAGLVTENSQRLYAVLSLTKVNDGPLSPWMLLEHSKRAGLWIATPEGEKALAVLRGGDAAEKLEKAEEILLALHAGQGRNDEKEFRKELIAQNYPDDPKGSDHLKSVLQDLRRRKFWLRSGSLELTPQGVNKALDLKGRQTIEVCLPEELENQQGIDFE